MSETPAHITARLDAQVIDGRRPTYLHVDAEARIITITGEPEHYGLDGIEPGGVVDDTVPFLAGLFPVAGGAMIIECIEPTPGVYCDAHLAPGDGDDSWVLLLDCTETTEVRRSLQQRGNELALLKEQLEKQNRELAESQAESKRVLRAMVPEAIALRLEAGEQRIVERYESATVAFVHIGELLACASDLSAVEQAAWLEPVFRALDASARELNLQPILIQADTYIVAGGVPDAHDDHAAAVTELVLRAQALATELAIESNTAAGLRAGIATGSFVAGTLGTSARFGYDVWGDTVTSAEAMQRSAPPGTVQVTEPVRDALQQRYRFEERGAYYLKGGRELITYLLVGRCD